jgi:hypothetical protein
VTRGTWCWSSLLGLLAAGCLAKSPGPRAESAPPATAVRAASPAGAGPRRAGLPPDPGALGSATIAGVDADGDGVRDDVQRFVMLSYPDSQRTQAALLQLARALQAWLAVPARDADAAHAAAEQSGRASECLFAVTTAEKAYAASTELKLRVLDTAARQDAFYAADALLGGSVFESHPDGGSGATCSFNPRDLPN